MEKSKENVSNGFAGNEILEDHCSSTITETSNPVENKVPNNNNNEVIDLKIQALRVKSRHNSFQSSISEDENPLVIVEDVDEEKKSDAESNEAETTINTEEIQSLPKKTKSKKRKSAKIANTNKKKKSNESTEEFSSVVLTIPSVLEEIRRIKIEDLQSSHSHAKLLVHKLFTVLINPSNAPSTVSALYQIFNHLSSSKQNPLMSFIIKKDSSVFCPPSEKCIVDGLLKVEHKKKNHLQGLISSAITNLYYLVLEKKNISKYGLGAFCRIFTQLCKHTKNDLKPMTLCCDLIKRKHPLSTYLIACIMGVWKELFVITDETKESILLLQSSIAYGVQKKPPSLTSTDWKQIKALFSEYLTAPPAPNPAAAAKFIIENLKESLKETQSEMDYTVVEPLAVFSALEGWTWARENIVKNFLIPSLRLYSQQKENERAFSLLCKLYAEMGMFTPDDSVGALSALWKFFVMENAFGYVKTIAAISLAGTLLYKDMAFPALLRSWVAENENILVGTSVHFYIRCRLIADEPNFSESDITSVTSV